MTALPNALQRLQNEATSYAYRAGEARARLARAIHDGLSASEIDHLVAIYHSAALDAAAAYKRAATGAKRMMERAK